MQLVVLGVLFLTACGAMQAQEYDLVRKYRPKVGDTEAFGIRFTQEQTTRLKTSGKIVPGENDKNIQLELGGPREVLTSDKAGHESKWKITVKFFTFQLNGAKIPVLKKDDVITLDEGSAQFYLVNGQPPERNHEAVLNMLFPPNSSQDKSGQHDDEILPGHKVKVGDTWPVKVERANGLIAGLGIPITTNAFRSSVTLESAKPKDGVPCLQTLAEISLDSENVTDLDSVPNFQGKKFFVLSRQRLNFPVDPTLPQVSEQTQVRFEMETAETAMVGGKRENVLTRQLISTEISTAHLK